MAQIFKYVFVRIRFFVCLFFHLSLSLSIDCTFVSFDKQTMTVGAGKVMLQY